MSFGVWLMPVFFGFSFVQLATIGLENEWWDFVSFKRASWIV